MVGMIGEPPACQGPAAPPRGATRFVVPAGAVDTHAHVIGLPPAYPLVPERRYTAPEASAAAYLAMLDATGMDFGVLVQASVHGVTNDLMMEVLRANRQRLRGIAVAPHDLADRAYQALRDGGVRGLRLNVLYGGGIGFAHLAHYGALCRDWGWHLQFLVDARDLPALSPLIAKLPVPVVVDHMGHFPTSEGIDCQGFQTLLAMVRDRHWVKLSGAFRTSVGELPFADTIPFARALLAASPERCVWGSDWPHVAHPGPMMNVGELLDLVADWCPDPAMRHRMLVDNPQRLYGFEAG